MLISIPRLEACKLLTSRPEPEEPEPTIKETEVAPTLAREPSVPYVSFRIPGEFPKIGGGLQKNHWIPFFSKVFPPQIHQVIHFGVLIN